jgi:hypothetical protein
MRPSLLALALLLGCPAPVDVDDDDATAADDDDATPYEPPGPWADLDRLQRIEYMENLVEPAARELFQEFDPELYAEFGCETCHGEDPADHDYAMPSGALEALSISEINGLANNVDPDRARYAALMDDVKATVAPLVGQQPFPSGSFSCFDCHEQE